MLTVVEWIKIKGCVTQMKSILQMTNFQNRENPRHCKIHWPTAQLLGISLIQCEGLCFWKAPNVHVAFPIQRRWESGRMSPHHYLIQLYSTQLHKQVLFIGGSHRVPYAVMQGIKQCTHKHHFSLKTSWRTSRKQRQSWKLIKPDALSTSCKILMETVI